MVLLVSLKKTFPRGLPIGIAFLGGIKPKEKSEEID
jgi:hypothetical protein